MEFIKDQFQSLLNIERQVIAEAKDRRVEIRVYDDGSVHLQVQRVGTQPTRIGLSEKAWYMLRAAIMEVESPSEHPCTGLSVIEGHFEGDYLKPQQYWED